MNYLPPSKPADASGLFEVLGDQYAKDQLKLRQIKQKQNPQYEEKKLPEFNRGMRGPTGEVNL